jgi:hypothetical protein
MLNPPPTGNVEVGEARELIGQDIVLMPCLTQVFESMQSEAAVRASVRRMFREMQRGGGFVPILIADPSKTMADLELLLDEARQSPL